MIKAIVVGNGPSLDGIGEEIDKFDIIIRCNKFKTKGYESRVGTRTDVWVPGGLKYPNGFDEKPDVPIWALYPYHSRKDMIEEMPIDIQRRIVPLDTRIMQALQIKLGFDIYLNGWVSTTGMSALEYAVSEFGMVYYSGFNFTTEHYFGGKREQPKCHNYKRERMYVESNNKMVSLI